MLHVLTRWCLVLAVSVLIAAPVAAQTGSLFPLQSTQSEANTPDIGAILERAAEQGLGVIVINADGTLQSLSEANAASPAPGSGSSSMSLMQAQEDANAFRAALVERLAGLPQALEEVVALLREKSPDGTVFAFVEVLIYSLALFAVGMVAERQIYGKRIARGFITARIRENPQGYAEKMPFLTVRFLGGVIGVLFSMVVAYVLGFLIFGGPIENSAIQYTATLVNIGYFSARVVAGLWRMILSPYLPQYRIPVMTDADSRRLHLWLCSAVSFGIFALLLIAWVQEFGLNPDVLVLLASLLTFLTLLVNGALVLVNRRTVSRAILHGLAEREATWPQRVLARFWVLLALAYLVFAWLRGTYELVITEMPGTPLVLGAYLIMTIVLASFGVINYLIERGFARARAMRALNEDNRPEDTAPVPDVIAETRPRLTTFEDLAQRIAGILALVVGLVACLAIWQPQTDMMQESLTQRVIDILVILFLGYVAYHAFRIWIDAKIREEQGEEEPGELGDEGGGSSASRLATLLPLFRNVVLIVIVVSVLLIVLMEIGVNVGPLFAGAGIVGVAIGFGSQTLVRDIFSGAFFLFDDAFRKGEYIEIGEVRGTVEKISVRSFQLRHHLGKLHTIPFGEIQVLTNYSRDWVMMKLPLRVTYDTDVDKVRKLIKKLGQQLLEDPELGPDFLQPLKSQGVIEMQDSAMIIRVKFMTKPGDQWVIRKRVFQEIRDLFEREGIKFAHREVTVRLADGDAADLPPARRDAVMAAAEAAIEADLEGSPEPAGDDR
jgi:small-conductance mechanosensitive channel